MTADQQAWLQLLLSDTVQRQALIELAGDIGPSRAKMTQAVLSLGMAAVRERVQEIGYQELAESTIEDEWRCQRLEVESRRRRGR